MCHRWRLQSHPVVVFLLFSCILSAVVKVEVLSHQVKDFASLLFVNFLERLSMNRHIILPLIVVLNCQMRTLIYDCVVLSSVGLVRLQQKAWHALVVV